MRQVEVDRSRHYLLSDTVGFIRKLPAHLVASFKSTLAEASEADILLHVCDISHPHFREHILVVNDTLAELGATGKPTIFVFNKIDLVTDRSVITELKKEYSPAVFISAERGINIPTLNDELLALIEHDVTEQTLLIGQSEYGTIAKLHEIAEIVDQQYEDNSIRVRFRVTQKNMERLKKLLGRQQLEIDA